MARQQQKRTKHEYPHQVDTKLGERLHQLGVDIRRTRAKRRTSSRRISKYYVKSWVIQAIDFYWNGHVQFAGLDVAEFVAKIGPKHEDKASDAKA